MRTIYFSAHLDDAILSCGGLIYDQTKRGIPVEIWTYFCGVPKGESETPYMNRADENCRAANIVGAKPVNEYLLDAFGRGYKTVFTPIDYDKESIDEIVAGIERQIKPEDKLMVPLGVGEHVDHVVLRKACEQLNLPLTYYIDFPYIEYQPEKLNDVIQELKKYAVTISPEGLSHWVDAVKEYASQAFYETPEITREKIINYWAPINGILLWEKPSTEQIFTKIYHENAWKDDQTASGPGSRLEETEIIRSELPRLIEKYKINSILDLPCGDFFWMRTVDLNIDYTGADIVLDMIRNNQLHYGSYSNKRFICIDILGNRIPSADLFLCRDCLPHLSQKDVLQAIKSIISSTCSYLFTTTFPEVETNLDIVTGAWRPINLQIHPYNFPIPLESFDEQSPNKLYGIKCMSLWAIKDIKDII